MIQRNQKKTFERAGSTVEYMALILLLLSALLVFDRHILRAFWGHWKKTSDAFGHGKQFDPRGFGPDGTDGGTRRCLWVYTYDVDDVRSVASDEGVWVTQPCFDNCRLEGKSVATCSGAAECLDTNYCARE